MATTDTKRPKGDKGSWDWANLDRFAILHHDIAGGESAHGVMVLNTGTLDSDIHIDKVYVSLENAPGTDKTVTVTVSDGTSTITVAIADAATYGSSTTNHFDLDVSTETLTVAFSTTGGTAAGCMSIIILYHDITITA